MARGFGATLGAGTTDAAALSLSSFSTQRSWSVMFNGRAAGGSSAGRIITRATTETEIIGYDASTATLQFLRQWTTLAKWTITGLSANTWYQLVITYDSGSTSNDPVIYINGASQTVTEVTAPSGTLSGAGGAYISGNRTGGARVWDGLLAEVAVYDAILTAGEAAALGKGLSPLLVRPQSLVEYVPMLRDNVSLKRAAPTLTGTVIANHPRVYMPKRRGIIGVAAAGGGGGTVRDLAGSIALQTAFAGSSGIVFGVSGAIAAQTAFNGALKARFAVTGAIQAQTTFAGNLTVTAGAQPGIKDLAGSIAVQTAFNAALKQRLVIAGSFAPQFAFAGTLVGNVVAIDITGSISAAVTFGSIDIETESNSWAPQSPGSELWTTASHGGEIWTVQGPGAEVWIRQ